MKECPICHKEFKNVGSHVRFAHPGGVIPCDGIDDIHLEIDQITEEPLSKLLSDLRQILGKFQNEISTKILEKNGKPYEVEIVGRIKI